jgi:murein L,D-transpeptidase YafK
MCRALVIIGLVVSAACASRASDRVAEARPRAEAAMRARFLEAGVAYPARSLVVRVFKDEDRVELWAADAPERAHVVVARWPVCARSGELGPKRQKGDLQVPEGFYVVDRMNPRSNFHLSLGVDYPNAADRIAARGLHEGALGGDIFIHGACVTIGCVPIENDAIEELYIAVKDARAKGAPTVEVQIYPARLDDQGLSRLIARVGERDPRVPLWRNLAEGERVFSTTKRPLKPTVDERGRYVFERRAAPASASAVR